MLFVASSTANQRWEELQVVLDADPPALILHTSNKTLIFVVEYHILENVYSSDKNINPIPIFAVDLPKIRDGYMDLRK